MEEKILTNKEVKELGLGKVKVISADMLDGYTSIEYDAFYGCTSLTSITIPNSVTYIGDYTFAGCSSLTSVTIGESVTNIGTYTFYNCRNLASVTIPNSVTSIEGWAFEDCTSLTSVHISDIAAWCRIAFGSFYANPLYYAHNLYLNGTLVTDLVIPNSVTSIGDWAFYGCSNLKSITIPNSITSIGTGAFSNCSGLTSVTIGNSVTSIGERAFSGCYSLESVTIPNSVTSIGIDAFYYCSSLTSVTIPNSVTIIGDYTFYCCKSLKSIVIPNSVTSIGNWAFSHCRNLDSITIGDKEYKANKVVNGKCKAYKGFNADMTCRNFQYKEGETYEFDGEPKLCVCGFHACLKLSDVFDYYSGRIGKKIVVYEVELEGVSDERNKCDSKIVASKITIGKRIL